MRADTFNSWLRAWNAQTWYELSERERELWLQRLRQTEKEQGNTVDITA